MKQFTIKRLSILMLALFALVPAAALADTTPSPAAQSQARQDCTKLQTSLTAATFKQTYGTNANRSNAFGKCVSKMATAEQQNLAAAPNACQAEQSDPNFAANHAGKTFDQTYGTGNLKNALGKCVSTKAKAASTQDVQAVEAAAKACSAERATDPAAFKTKYGTNANKANAFGKCVSAKAKTQS
jgi:hypothetical protein